ncbi:serine/threonine protein phosphatase [Brachybacterium halotolerans subsp. kimchii]|uniref:serine/threonine protein phosphatase n=1 Tax=Brachybacterium halotolerans TaxID=2795215 RepID=UPI001E539935|nr:serine/threonine protein phosphatase [Brachybacterium halotolerans]UEJ81238.1 serine/threonine protein phosphatase [Brachybacterium halotolerans subsp. kimchii]
MSTGASPRPDAADVFDHLRAEDGEHVGYMEMTADGGFVPYDLLWQRRGEPMDLDEAEAVLDGIGLRLLAEDWLLQEEAGWTRVRIREIDRDRVVVGRAIENMSAHVAKAIDLVGGIDVALPTDRLRLAGAAR